MTPDELEQNWLSLRYWLIRIVMPTNMVLLTCLLLLKFVSDNPADLNQSAVIMGFFSFYFVAVRGGHLLMIRSMHFDLKRKYKDKYTEELARLPKDIRRKNLGFSLARIKRELSFPKQ